MPYSGEKRPGGLFLQPGSGYFPAGRRSPRGQRKNDYHHRRKKSDHGPYIFIGNVAGWPPNWYFKMPGEQLASSARRRAKLPKKDRNKNLERTVPIFTPPCQTGVTMS
ncbi:hypothetical protein FAGKG844_70153 [Frankia sp. AgKG'84/4]